MTTQMRNKDLRMTETKNDAKEEDCMDFPIRKSFLWQRVLVKSSFYNAGQANDLVTPSPHITHHAFAIIVIIIVVVDVIIGIIIVIADVIIGIIIN